MILAATRDAARLFLELGTVTVVLAVGARLAARRGFSSIPLYLVAGSYVGLEGCLPLGFSSRSDTGCHTGPRPGRNEGWPLREGEG